jgi:hypothetical protein
MRPAPASERSHLSAVGGTAIRQLCSPRIRSTARVGWAFTLAAAAYNLIRLPKLLGALP